MTRVASVKHCERGHSDRATTQLRKAAGSRFSLLRRLANDKRHPHFQRSQARKKGSRATLAAAPIA